MQSPALPQLHQGAGAWWPLSAQYPLLDMQGALALLDNSTDLYVEISQAYMMELAQLAADAPNLLSQADMAGTVRTLHTFKGLSLTIGAQAMSEVCRQCELLGKEALHSGALIPEASRLHAVHALQSAAQMTQARLSEALASLAPEEIAPLHAGETNRADAIADLQALKELLIRSDLQALDNFRILRARHRFVDGQLAPLDLSISAFDFAQAVVQCDDLIRTMGSPYRT